MWNSLDKRKNSYLQSRVHVMNPSILNRCIDKAFWKWDSRTIYPRRKVFQNQLLPIEPQNFGEPVEIQKVQLAFGMQALPILMKQICTTDKILQYKALNALSDLLYNPLEVHRAIYEYDIVKRLEAILLEKYPETRQKIPVLDIILKNLRLLSKHYEAAWRMVVQYELMNTLCCLVKNSCFKCNAACILQSLSSHPSVAEIMLVQGHLTRAFNLLKKDDTIDQLYVHLSQLLARSPAEGMDLKIFDFLLSKICKDSNIQSSAMKCVALLLNTAEAHQLFDEIDGVKVLYEILKNQSICPEMIQNTLMALKNCTINKSALWRCREFYDLPLILLRHAHDKENDITQLYALQVLRQITVMPSVKDFVRKVCKRHIKAIECRAEFVSDAKRRLLVWLRKKNYINCEPTNKVEEPAENLQTVDKDEEYSEWESEIVEDDDIKRELSVLSDICTFPANYDKAPEPIAYRLDYGHTHLGQTSASQSALKSQMVQGKATTIRVLSFPNNEEKQKHNKEASLILNEYRDQPKTESNEEIVKNSSDSLTEGFSEMFCTNAAPKPTRKLRTIFVQEPPGGKTYVWIPLNPSHMPNRRAAVLIANPKNEHG